MEMAFPNRDLAPMEAKLVAALPGADDPPGSWQYEPKWDGFRCLAFHRRGTVHLMSKSGKDLARYFPEVAAAVAALPGDWVLDGELIIALDGRLSFSALQARLHPAPSRIARLSAETPAQLMLFDCLWADDAPALIARPLAERRAVLERATAGFPAAWFQLSPATAERGRAEAWLAQAGGALDGVVAKRRDAPYQPGERAMLKVKPLRTADCVVGGFRYATKPGPGGAAVVGSLLLGLYDDTGRLHHVGFTSALAGVDRAALTQQLEALIAPPGFTGAAPGGPSRWASERSTQWQPLRPELVVEVRYDQVTERRFRHGTAFLRWRPDKAPRQCGFDQLAVAAAPERIAAMTGNGTNARHPA